MAVDVTSLSNAAVKYQEALRLLPYMELLEVLPDEGIRLIEVASKDVETEFQRKRGGTKPYDPANVSSSDLGKTQEFALEVEPCYYNTEDNIKDYQKKKILGKPNAGDGELNQKKKHPLEMLILREQPKTVGEDILDAMYSGDRDLADQTPSGTVDGYDKILDDAVTATTISLANGNLVNTGALDAPVSGTDTLAIDRIVTFVRSANRFLRKGGILKITNAVYHNALSAMGNKTSNFSLVTKDMLVNYINEQAQAKITLVISDYMGTGQRIVLTVDQNFDMGMNTRGDVKFIQVRGYGQDPNIVQFWTQFDLGTRIRGFHQKILQINELAAAHADLGGDYA